MKCQENKAEEREKSKNTSGILLVSAVVVLLLGSYISSWFFLPQLGLAGPMANLAYFYYGKSHTRSDSALYIVYYPLYWYETKSKGHSRYGIHWSDRKDPPPPTLSDLVRDGMTDNELKEMGFTDKEGKS